MMPLLEWQESVTVLHLFRHSTCIGQTDRFRTTILHSACWCAIQKELYSDTLYN